MRRQVVFNAKTWSETLKSGGWKRTGPAIGGSKSQAKTTAIANGNKNVRKSWTSPFGLLGTCSSPGTGT
ncbi:MAG: hypothetical protein K2W85_06350 [Phycisphaerales bacterium]|nr:hypothetical protein [Phycisphaerales bacterium]